MNLYSKPGKQLSKEKTLKMLLPVHSEAFSNITRVEAIRPNSECCTN